MPLPDLSPRERLREMLVFRNRTNLYNRTCCLTGKRILSCIPPDKPHHVCDVDEWQADSWDPLSYGRPYDPNRSFLEQLGELYQQVPMPNLAVVRPLMENSDYTNGITGAKNCYLIFSSSYNEDCLFSQSLWRCRNVIDSVFLTECELCFECVDLRNCFDLRYSEHCINCSNSAFLFNCASCRNCYGCANLAHKEYHFFNEPLSKAEYEARMREIDLSRRSVVERERARCREFSTQFPLKCFFGKQTELSSGNHLNNTKHCVDSYFVSNSEEVFHSLYLDGSKFSFAHAMFGNNTELVYNCVTAGDDVYNLRFCIECWMNSHDLEYCIGCCYGTSNCFGSVSLRKHTHCVLNVQYSPDEYVRLVNQIKSDMRARGEYGRFLPKEFAPFFYNESQAQEFFPLSRDEALVRGYTWNDSEPSQHRSHAVVPDAIRDVPDSILQETLTCARSGKAFKIIQQELELYRKFGLPAPTVSPMERIRSRLGFFELHQPRPHRCDSCRAPIETYHPESSHPIYCEPCFQNSMFG